jgi:hypothetical protein
MTAVQPAQSGRLLSKARPERASAGSIVDAVEQARRARAFRRTKSEQEGEITAADRSPHGIHRERSASRAVTSWLPMERPMTPVRGHAGMTGAAFLTCLDSAYLISGRSAPRGAMRPGCTSVAGAHRAPVTPDCPQ